MKVVVGCPVKDRAWVIPQWLRAIHEQEVDADVEILCVVSPSEDDTEKLLLEGGVKVIRMLKEHYSRPKKDIDGHVWNEQAYDFMATVRNGLKIRAFRDFGADYFFSLDSDVILPKGGLAALLAYAQRHPGVVSPAVNMVARGTAWNVMSWVDPDRPSMAHRPIEEPQSGQSDVIMAAMLIPRVWAPIKWAAHRQGEDVGYSIDAARRGVVLWWVPEVRCAHFMYQF